MTKPLNYCLAILLFISTQAFGQKSQIFIAQNSLGKLQKSISNKEDKKKQIEILKEGIKAVEAAEKDKKTRKWSETWAIKAYLYSYLMLIDDDATNNDKYYNLAVEAFENAKKNDKYDRNLGLINASKTNIIIKKQEKGNQAFANFDYYEAFNQLKEVSDFYPTDTTLAINTAICAQNIQNYNDALKYLIRAKDNNVKNRAVYQNLAYIYSSKFNTELALKSLEDGLKLCPNDNILVNDYINLLIDNEKFSKALELIESTIKIEKGDKLLYFLYGYLQQISNSDNIVAEMAYKKALDRDQNYFDALYQLGLVYINRANEALKLKDENKINQFNGFINRSQLTLLHAYEINPNDKNTIQLLIDIYTRKNSFDKVQELKRKLEEF